jgi:hypothetical protein
MLSLVRRERAVHDDGSYAGMDDMAAAAAAGTILPGVCGKWKSDEKKQGEDNAYHEICL